MMGMFKISASESKYLPKSWERMKRRNSQENQTWLSFQEKLSEQTGLLPPGLQAHFLLSLPSVLIAI